MNADERDGSPSKPVAGDLPQMLWFSGRYHLNIRVDAPVGPADLFEPHAHVHDEAGRELVVVNRDGSARHGTGGRLHPRDAGVLGALGYAIPDDFRIE